MNTIKFCECVKRYQDDFYLLTLSILKNESDAEDAVGNAILQAYEHQKQIRAPHKFRNWMLVITKNEALKIMKKRLYLPGDEAVCAMAAPTHSHYDEMWDVLCKMKEEYRLAVVLFYYEGLSLRDISDVLGIPVGTVKSRLSRGKQELKKELERRD